MATAVRTPINIENAIMVLAFRDSHQTGYNAIRAAACIGGLVRGVPASRTVCLIVFYDL